MQIVEIFINELSWNIKNYQDEDSLRESITIFSNMLSLIIEKNKSYSNLNLFFSKECLSVFLKEEFVTEYEPDNLELIKRRLDYSRNWQEIEFKQHSPQDNFYHLNLFDNELELVNNKSLAEITQRKLEEKDCIFLILNFGNSPYGREKFLSLLKKTHTELPKVTHIQQIDNIEELKKWLHVEIEWKNCLEPSKFKEIKEIYEKSQLIHFDFNSWNPSENYLPLTEISNHLVGNDWKKFSLNLLLHAPQKMSLISEMAEKVAIINGYTFDEQISKLNQSKEHKREIYSAGQNRNKIYLSVDFETGGYEICDFQGIHLGEFWFDGIKAKKADAKHNITLKK